MTPRPAWAILPATLVVGWAALAQSPPDLQPSLTGAGKPVIGGAAQAQSDKPRLQEPPRAPAVPDGAMSTPPAPSPAAALPR